MELGNGGDAGSGGSVAVADRAGLVRIVEVWAHGWARARTHPVPRVVPGGLRIELGRPRDAVRYILPDPDPVALRDLDRTAAAPHTWIKVFAPHAEVAPLLSPAWHHAGPQYLMTAPMPPSSQVTPAPPGYRLDTEECDGILDVRVWATGEAADRPAASGRAALIGGTGGAPLSAVFDMITTEPEHRRRGLGRLVMTVLGIHAARRGASEGLLVATPSGRELYASLGWCLRSPATEMVCKG
ncbi:GNAT family N-acetyltransferase [Streptomyces catenulae]|uniref:GNAT family N-acetyltransferase n=1 Tax=Streptomyces catenulae TaxID=66875 RepID=A0ABV2YU68_9ACTN|nr:GNAT family N-acetyltransferase [Streptomyces catenulae]